MDTTIFLAQIWGPVILAAGIGFFTSREYYIRIYRDLEKEPLAMLIFGMIGIAVGIIHIQAHNVWETLPQIVVSLLGWALLLKSTAFAVVPHIVDKSGNWALRIKLNPIARIFTIIVAAYLVWLGYFS